MEFVLDLDQAIKHEIATLTRIGKTVHKVYLNADLWEQLAVKLGKLGVTHHVRQFYRFFELVTVGGVIPIIASKEDPTFTCVTEKEIIQAYTSNADFWQDMCEFLESNGLRANIDNGNCYLDTGLVHIHYRKQ